MIVKITLREAHGSPEPFNLTMYAAEPASWPHAVAAGNLPFGHVLQEVSRFLELNLNIEPIEPLDG